MCFSDESGVSHNKWDRCHVVMNEFDPAYGALRNEMKWYFAKWYFGKRYFAKRYFAKWYFAKDYFAKWFFAKRYFAKWHRLGLRVHGISSIEFHRNSVRLSPID